MGPGARRGRRRGLIVGAAVGRRAAERNNANDEPAAAAPVDSGTDQIAQLEQLAALKEKGILTEEEFAAKKKEILGL